MDGETVIESTPQKAELTEDIFKLFEANITSNEVKRESIFQIAHIYKLENNLQYEIVVDILYLAIDFFVSKKLNYMATKLAIQLILEELEKVMNQEKQQLDEYYQSFFLQSSDSPSITSKMKGVSLEDDDSFSSPIGYRENATNSRSLQKHNTDVEQWINKFQSLYEEHKEHIDVKAWKHISGYFIQNILPDIPSFAYIFNFPPEYSNKEYKLKVVVDTPLNLLYPLQPPPAATDPAVQH